MNVNAQTNETSVKPVRTRTNKRTETVKYDTKARQVRITSVIKAIKKMAESGEQITVPTIAARLKLALKAQFKSGAIKPETFTADLNSIVKSLGLEKIGLVEDTNKRGRKPIIYAFNPSSLSPKAMEINNAIDEENAKAKARAEKKAAKEAK